MGGMVGIFSQNTNPRKRLERESPIASLKLLQAQQRQLTVDTVVMSDDESGVQGRVSDSDDEFSDSSNELSIRNCDISSKSLKATRYRHHVSHEDVDENTGLMYQTDRRENKGSSRWGPKPNGKAHLQKFIVPDIVIDDTSVTVANHGSEKRPRTPRHDNSDQVTGYIVSHGEAPKQDNIMWL